MLVTRQSIEPSDAITGIVLLTESEGSAWLAQQPTRVKSWIQVNGFCGERNKLLLIPSEQGALEFALLGLGGQASRSTVNLWDAAGLVDRLPQGSYQLLTQLSGLSLNQFVLGWEYGQYRFEQYKQKNEQKIRRLVIESNIDGEAVSCIQGACSLARDLINTPANQLTPKVLVQHAVNVANTYGATVLRYSGDELLHAGFPTVHAVGRAAAERPEIIDFSWGNGVHPKVTLVGKGVCFDTGGLDIKPASGMALMKKDMGGAACVIALAQLIMQAQLPLRLRVIIPAGALFA